MLDARRLQKNLGARVDGHWSSFLRAEAPGIGFDGLTS